MNYFSAGMVDDGWDSEMVDLFFAIPA